MITRNILHRLNRTKVLRPLRKNPIQLNAPARRAYSGAPDNFFGAMHSAGVLLAGMSACVVVYTGIQHVIEQKKSANSEEEKRIQQQKAKIETEKAEQEKQAKPEESTANQHSVRMRN